VASLSTGGLTERARLSLPPLSSLFGDAGHVYAGGADTLVEIAGDSPEGWKRLALPRGSFRTGAVKGGPWFAAEDGSLSRLLPGPRLELVARMAGASRCDLQALDRGRLAVVPQRRFLRSLRVVDPAGRSLDWRRRGTFALRATLGDLLLFSPGPTDPRTLICVDASTGTERWRWQSPPGEVVEVHARVDDAVCLTVSGRYLLSLDAATGRERLRLAPGPLFATSMPDAKGRCHLLSATRQHWRADLRRASLEELDAVTQAEDGPESPQPLLPLDDGTLLTRDRVGRMHRLGDGSPRYLWIEPEASIVSAWPLPGGLAVLSAAYPTSGVARERRVHLLGEDRPGVAGG
jgi:hypothetical protein